MISLRDTINEHYIELIGATLLLTTITLWGFGQPLICPCGEIKLWHGLIDAQSSNHLTDWFTLQHLLTGMILYWVIKYAAPDLPAGTAFLLAFSVEAAWELVENTPWVIERFRDTAHITYRGDAIINSVTDMLAMIPGYILARRNHWSLTLILGGIIELLTLYMIHDSLILSTLMFIYPIEAIKTWQIAAWP